VLTLISIPFRFTIRRQIRLITNTPVRPTQKEGLPDGPDEPRSTMSARLGNEEDS
jgi:hypothetical protein